MDSSSKPIGPSHPLVSAFLAVVLAWAASLAITFQGLIYGIDDGSSASGLVKLFMVVAAPVALTAVSFEAVRRQRSSRFVWLAMALLLIFALFHLRFFIEVFNIGLLLFPSAFFLFLAASRKSVEEGPARDAPHLVPTGYNAWTRFNASRRWGKEPGE